MAGFDFGGSLMGQPANGGRQYGYDFEQKKWGWGTQGPQGFKLPGGTSTTSKTPAQIITDIINQGTAAKRAP